MKIARFAAVDGPRLGVYTGETVIDLVEAVQATGLAWMRPAFSDLRLFLAAGTTSIEFARTVADRESERSIPSTSVRFLPPFELGSRVFAHVVNYAGHDIEANVKMPVKPFFFPKLASSVCGPHDPIRLDRLTNKLDYEMELAVVVGRLGRDIAREDAWSYVAGFAVSNDVSARALQFCEGEPSLRASYGMDWIHGKGQDTFCPLGPAVTIREHSTPEVSFRMICRVNGVVRQDARTSDMYWPIPDLLSELSKGITLHPGDVILTGAPAGGGLADGQFLGVGDLVECEIEGVGSIRNMVLAG